MTAGSGYFISPDGIMHGHGITGRFRTPTIAVGFLESTLYAGGMH